MGASRWGKARVVRGIGLDSYSLHLVCLPVCEVSRRYVCHFVQCLMEDIHVYISAPRGRTWFATCAANDLGLHSWRAEPKRASSLWTAQSDA